MHLALCLLLGLSSPGSSQIQTGLEASTDQSLGERLERVSRPLKNRPYGVSPLGEGRGQDADPRFRLDRFDCTTFVETSLALSYSQNLDEAERWLDQIRYNGEPSFENRRHFVSAQWRPGLIQDGFLKDRTREIGGRHTREVELNFDKKAWSQRRVARSLKLPESALPWGRHRLRYVPIAALERMKSKLPSGLVVNVVRAKRAGRPILVTHQGLLLKNPKGRGLVFRHASPVAKKVIDEPLDHMLRRYAKPRAWPVLGLNFLEPVKPSHPVKPLKPDQALRSPSSKHFK